MFKDHNITPSEFNFIVSPIAEMPAKKSDHGNGYFIVPGLWGTCFFRFAKNRDRFEITGNNNPKCAHTYTKIPAALVPRTFFVYVNFRAGFEIQLPVGGILIGMHQAQAHRHGGWWSQTALVYSPTGAPPVVCERASEVAPDELRIRPYDEEMNIRVETITCGYDVRFIAVNEEGFYKPDSLRPRERIAYPYTPATQTIGEFWE